MNRMVLTAASCFIVTLLFPLWATGQAKNSDDFSIFNERCKSYFGAEKEPLTYQAFGDKLQFVETGDWVHGSQTSACVGVETNLPAAVSVEFGETDKYGSRTEVQERPYYIHVHYLRGLKADTKYHYRLVATDERGNKLTGPDRTLETRTVAGAIAIPGELGAAPYKLDKPGATYIVTKDLTLDGAGFEITAKDVTLDLDGHVVVYNNKEMPPIEGDQWEFYSKSAIGVRLTRAKGFTLVNGVIRQGKGNGTAQANSYGFSPIANRSAEGLIAGITADYGGSQVSGLAGHYPGKCEIHHNIIIDRGVELTNRHQGVQTVGIGGDVHHNLIKRARQRGVAGFNGGTIRSNEIYVDSCATNSFGVFCYKTKNCEIKNNRIFGSGYLMIGVGTVSEGVADIKVHSNFIHLQAHKPDSRWAEYGEQSGAYCARITWGGENLDYANNYMITKGRDKGMVRGVWVSPQPNIINCVFRNNIIKVIAENDATTLQGAIVVCGDAKEDDAPIIFRENTIISNFCNVLFGEPYGSGCNVKFVSNKFVRVGPQHDYRTVQIGFWNQTNIGHQFVDSTFEGGANLDSVRFKGEGKREFSVGWTVKVTTNKEATFAITDASGKTVFTSKPATEATVELMQYKHTPEGKQPLGPYTITAAAGEKMITRTVDPTGPVEVNILF